MGAPAGATGVLVTDVIPVVVALGSVPTVMATVRDIEIVTRGVSITLALERENAMPLLAVATPDVSVVMAEAVPPAAILSISASANRTGMLPVVARWGVPGACALAILAALAPLAMLARDVRTTPAKADCKIFRMVISFLN